MDAAGVDPIQLRSPSRFAELLRMHNVEPGVKVSPRTGKPAFAFAKTDEFMRGLLNHPDPMVVVLAEAKMGVQTSLMASRLSRFLAVHDASGGRLPVPLLFFGAHTGRYSGYDKLNLQNMPARQDASLRETVIAPDGYKVVAADLSQIEARMTAVLAGCTTMVDAFARGDG